MSKRIDKKDIVDGQKLVSPFNPFLDPNSYIQSGKTTSTERYQSGNPYGTEASKEQIPPSFLENESTQTTPILANIDTPQLTDIESVTYTKYYDAVTKEEKVKAILKIRNSSKNPNNVAGVDARIYNPNA
jgi:hypothetical protein